MVDKRYISDLFAERYPLFVSDCWPVSRRIFVSLQTLFIKYTFEKIKSNERNSRGRWRSSTLYLRIRRSNLIFGAEEPIFWDFFDLRIRTSKIEDGGSSIFRLRGSKIGGSSIFGAGDRKTSFHLRYSTGRSNNLLFSIFGSNYGSKIVRKTIKMDIIYSKLEILWRLKDILRCPDFEK